ncbi:MAG: lycopene cyclase domain-containing protein [Thermoplasmatota archaeon]
MIQYLYLDAIILAGPLLFSFERRIRYYRKWPAVALSILTVGTAYIIWDVIATERGDWAFSETYTSGIYIAGLPLAEILFFVVVPYSCLFIYEGLHYYLPERNLPVPRWLYGGIAALALLLAVLYHDQSYTFTVLIVVAVFLIVAVLAFRDVLASLHFWLFLLLSFIGFLIFNYLLTSTPVVTYGSNAIWGVRVTTIPVEDFLYNISMLGFYFLAYWWTKTKMLHENKVEPI